MTQPLVPNLVCLKQKKNRDEVLDRHTGNFKLFALRNGPLMLQKFRRDSLQKPKTSKMLLYMGEKRFNLLSTTSFVTPFLIGSFHEMSTCSTNDDKALKIVNLTCT